MKKLITYTSRAAMTLLLFMAGFNQASASAQWVGASAINVNGTWYYGTYHDLNKWCSGGAFNDHNFGTITSLKIGGQSQIYDNNGAEWADGSTMIMGYRIDGGEDQKVTLTKYTFANNNNVFQSGGSGFTTEIVNISNLSPGNHTLYVWFGHEIDDKWDGGNNYQATFTIPATQTVSAGSGIATYSSAYNLDFSSTTNISAYIVSGLTQTAAALTKVTQVVPANTGLIIMGTASTSDDINVVTSASSAVGTNFLKASVTGTTVAANEAFVLSAGEFHPANAGTIPANKAYLLQSDIVNAGGGHARSLSLTFGDEETGISQVSNDQWIMGNYYDLSGRHVAQPTKGLYIVNGKKVIVK